jgi:hypothetical protein
MPDFARLFGTGNKTLPLLAHLHVSYSLGPTGTRAPKQSILRSITMKRCPECEFLYEDDQDHCEMDGTRLFFTTTLPPLPAGLTPPKSIWGGFTIPLLAALVLGTVVAILYRATPRAYSSPATVQTQTVSQKTSEVNQEPQPPASDTSEPPANASDESSVSDDASRDPFDPRKARVEKADSAAPASNEKAPSPAPAIHIEAAPNSQVMNPVTTESKTAATPPTLVTQASPGGQKSAVASSSVSSHPKPPAWSASPQPAKNVNKDSGINSFFKKAGKVLKKPFEN